MFSEIHTIWSVYHPAENPYPVDVEQYLAEHDFDYVIVETYPSNLKNDGVYFFMDNDTGDELAQ